jgi:hypothetical protein
VTNARAGLHPISDATALRGMSWEAAASLTRGSTLVPRISRGRAAYRLPRSGLISCRSEEDRPGHGPTLTRVSRALLRGRGT